MQEFGTALEDALRRDLTINRSVLPFFLLEVFMNGDINVFCSVKLQVESDCIEV